MPVRRVAIAASAFLLLGSAGVVALAAESAPVSTAPPAHHVAAIPPPAVVIPEAPITVAPAPPPTPAPAAVVPSLGPPTAHRSVVHAVPASLVVKPPAPAKPAPAPVSHTNFLTSDDGTLNAPIGTYSDCSGSSPLGTEASILSCITGRLYFVGHNYGVFTPIMHMDTGSGFTYWDGSGASHHFRVVSVRPSWSPSAGVPPITQSNVVAQFQTCTTPDGSIDRILDATLDGGSPLGNLITPVVAPVVKTVNSTGTAAVNTTVTTTNSFFFNLFGSH
jgi:hypothetical protein